MASITFETDRRVARIAVAYAPDPIDLDAIGADVTLHLWPWDDAPLDPSEDGSLRLGQRANRELARAVDALVNRTGLRPELHVVWGAPWAVAVDFGFRLASTRVRLWGGEPLAPMPPPEADAPFTTASAFQQGRSLASTTGPLHADDPAGGRLVLRGEDKLSSAASREAHDALDPARAAMASKAWGDALQHLDAVDKDGPYGRTALGMRVDALHAAGRPADAVKAVRALLDAAPGDANGLAQACRHLLRLDRPERAVDLATRLTTMVPGEARPWVLRAEAEAALQRRAESHASLVHALARQPSNRDAAVRLARACLAVRDAAQALAVATSALGHAPDDVDLREVRADAGVLLQAPEAVAWVRAAWTAQPDAWAAATARFAQLGAFDAAAEALSGGQGPMAEALRAHLALWRRSLDEAEGHAGSALAQDAAVVRGAVAILRGQPTEGLAALAAWDPTKEASPLLDAPTVWAWRAEALRALDRTEEARTAGSAAMSAFAASGANTYSLAAHLSRVLATLPPSADAAEPIDTYAYDELVGQLGDLLPAQPALDGTIGPARTALEAVRTRLGGNRSAWTTVVDAEHGLSAHRVPPRVRYRGRMLQLQLQSRPAADVLAGFEALASEHADDPLVRTYWGETLLWLGDLGAASARFREAIDLKRSTTWAWIGLGATQMLHGDVMTALRTWDDGVAAARFEGPTLFVYRGEAAWRLGNLDGAVRDLDRAIASKPQRMSAWILRALADADRGRPEPARAVSRMMFARSRGLWLDAQRRTGGGSDEDRDVQVLRSALALMCGNRSSSLVTYVGPGGQVRCGVWGKWLRPLAVFG